MDILMRSLSVLCAVLYMTAHNGFCSAHTLTTKTEGKAIEIGSIAEETSRILSELKRPHMVGFDAHAAEYNKMAYDFEKVLDRHTRSAAGIEVVSMVTNGIDAAHKMLHLYNETVNLIIPWDIFEDTINELRAYEDMYSIDVANMVGLVHELILNSSDQYHSSKEQVRGWCLMAVPLLRLYINLFEHIKDPQVADVQKMLLLKVLNDGLEDVKSAVEKLKKCTASFNKAYGRLTTLKSRLKYDLSEGSEFHVQALRKLRLKAYTGAAVGVVGGPAGLIVSYSIAAGVVEGKLIPKLTQIFEETLEKFDRMHLVVENAQNQINSTKNSLEEEIEALTKMSAKIRETKEVNEVWARLPYLPLLFETLRNSTMELIAMCNEYVEFASNI